MNRRQTLLSAAALVIGNALVWKHAGAQSPSEAEARAIAKEATIYGFPLLDSYRIQYSYFVDRNDPEFKGNWNELHHTARVYTPDDRAIQTPNSDTPYSVPGVSCSLGRSGATLASASSITPASLRRSTSRPSYA